MKAIKYITLMTLILTVVSCSQFLTHRDYLTEMERDDSSFYAPGDFPIVAGDTGNMYESSEERRLRTPRTVRDLEEEQTEYMLKTELRHLENKQSEASRDFYESYKHRLTTTSEKIYFLKLSHYERRDYLASRGIYQERTPASHTQEMFAYRDTSLNLGMTKEEVVNHWGKPIRVEVAGNPSFENERWLYNVHGASKYIYFESGRVGGWE